jgi:hypothetical protein
MNRRPAGALLFTLLLAGAVACGGSVKTSVYLEVRASGTGTRPDHVRIDVFGAGAATDAGSPDGGGPGALLGSATNSVPTGSDPLLGTLVIYPRAGDASLHIVVSGLVASAVTASSTMDVSPESGQQVTVTVTLSLAGGTQANGTRCTDGNACQSGFCVDGVCCDGACTGLCHACNLSRSAGSCTAVAAGDDPRGDCSDDGATTCQHDGTCDGQGACRLYPRGSMCGPSSCANGTTEMVAPACDGAGTCAPASPTTRDCSPYVCSGGGCLNQCSSPNDCVSTSICFSHRCR